MGLTRFGKKELRAANSGVSDRIFQSHGRWKSVAANNDYIKDDISSRLLVSKSLEF